MKEFKAWLETKTKSKYKGFPQSKNGKGGLYIKMEGENGEVG